ncbi:hypothetical protein NE237_028071 [Protea cynaroides]|uniref:Fe2OG dioxygenase domain-containing protein n=1 Tax=Protea cynaroides TaxID=273540 RepID=A0A9Q0GPP9_9MAGN|nr:hypothetical protein NE237_028071 [Protea cynaroides]
MDTLGLGIMELLGKSLGAGSYFREFFEGHDSILRHNWYPRCQTPHLTLGTGPHTDSVSIAILHQDDVGGLQVQIDNEWFNVSPYPGSFVVNIGETFMALTNGKYKIPLHRAVVNNEKARCSIVFFMNPQADKIIKPPGELVDDEINPRKFPDFTWGALHEFIQKEYRADHNTIHCFFERQQQQKKLKNTSTSSQ